MHLLLGNFLDRAMKRLQSVPAHKRIIAAFAGTVVLPCILLGVMAYRGIVNDQALVQQRQAERLTVTGESITRSVLDRLQLEASHIYTSLERNDHPVTSGLIQDRLLDSLIDDSQLITNVGFVSDAGVGILRSPLAYHPDGTLGHPTVDIPSDFPGRGVQLENRANQSAEAIAHYDSLLLISGTDRCQVLLALYRCTIKARDLQRASSLLKELLDQCDDEYVDNLPIAYIAMSELAFQAHASEDKILTQKRASSFATALSNHQIDIEASAFGFFSELIQSRLPDATDYSSLRKADEQTSAFIEFLNHKNSDLPYHAMYLPDFGNVISFIDQDSLVNTISFVLSQIPTIGWSISNQDNSLLAQAGRSSEDGVISTELNLGELIWRIDLWQAGPDQRTFFSSVRSIYLLTFILIAAILIFGLVFTLRAVRSELALTQLKSDFVSTVSHELKSPLTSIRHLAELLAAGKVRSDDRKQEYYNVIQEQGERLTLLIDNLLDFAKLEAGKKQYNFQLVKPGIFFEPIVELFRKRVSNEGFDVSLELHESLPNLNLDRNAMTQVLNNLLDNAYKYSGESKQIRVKGAQVNGHVNISVSDDGCGIKTQDLPHIFEKFYRAGDELTRTVKGSGIGLALVKQIIEDHNGKINVESSPGTGSTFTISLPIQLNGNA